jgi:hypothetical protein
MAARGSAQARSSPTSPDEGPVLDGLVAFGVACQDDHRHPCFASETGHPSHGLAVKGLRIQQTFTSDDQVGPLDPFRQVDPVGDEIEPADQGGTESRQATGQTARCAGPFDVLHVDTETVPIDLGQSLEPSRKQLHLGGRRSLLR